MEGFFNEKAVKWVEKENLHITLLFLGAIKEEKIEEVRKKLRKIKAKKPLIFMDKVVYHPPSKKNAKLIWARGQSKDLSLLQGKIEDTVREYDLSEEKEFKPHITLGRIRKWELKKMSLLSIPEINEDLSSKFIAESFSLVESKLKKDGPEYNLIEEYKLDD